MGLAGYGSLGQHVSVSDRLNTLNPLVNETEIVSRCKLRYCVSSLKYNNCVCSLERSLNVSLEEYYVVFSGQG